MFSLFVPAKVQSSISTAVCSEWDRSCEPMVSRSLLSREPRGVSVHRLPGPEAPSHASPSSPPLTFQQGDQQVSPRGPCLVPPRLASAGTCSLSTSSEPGISHQGGVGPSQAQSLPSGVTILPLSLLCQNVGGFLLKPEVLGIPWQSRG